jgi:hypothetical protein
MYNVTLRCICLNSCEKSVIIIYLSVCVCVCVCVCVHVSAQVCGCVHACSFAYPACNVYALYCDVIVALLAASHFPHYLINGTIFGNKLLNIKCVF